jgi:hypothetical protein
MRLVVQREDVVSRAALARDCALGMRSLHAELWLSLATADPMPKITQIQKSVEEKFSNAVRNQVWPYDPPHALASIEPELRLEVDEIRAKFMGRWAPPRTGVT